MGSLAISLAETVSSLRSPTTADVNLTASSRDLIRTHPWTTAGIWAPTLGGWLLLLWGATNMDSPAAQLMMPMSAWSVANWLAVFTMWTVMMAAMMLPSAVPMVLCFAALNRRRSEGARTLLFVSGYLALWTAFSGAAATTQWALQSLGWVSPMIVSMSSVLSGALLLIAGVFQFSRLKQACLRACRSPLGFLMSDWRVGLWGAWQMGIRHGLSCLGCCWALMALLFVGGVMNLLWIAALASLVAIEKIAPKGEVAAQVLGGIMIGVGVVRLVWDSSS
jgi:predicted metal-binding membrane protein